MQSGKRLDHVHGLRGIAALMVVVQHSFEMARLGGSSLFDLPLAHVNFGRFGVVLFFLISGLVVPYSFRGERPLRSFAISRFFRLYPAYWVSIAVFLAIAFWREAPIPAAQILANMTMVQSLLGEASIGNAYWTLLYEMIFYGLCMALCAAGMLRSAPVVGTIAAVCLAGSIAPALGSQGGDVNTVFYFFSLFFIGMVLRLAFVEQDAAAKRWAVLLAIAGTLTGMAMGGAFFAVAENGNRFFPTAALVSAMALPIPLFVLALWLKPLPGKALMFLGTVSYSVYLFQQPVLDLLSRVIEPGQWPLTYWLAVMIAVVAASAAVYRWVELPMLEWGKRLERRPAKKSAAPLAA